MPGWTSTLITYRNSYTDEFPSMTAERDNDLPTLDLTPRCWKMTNLTISTPPNPHPKPGDKGPPYSPPLTPNARPPFLQPIIWKLPERTTLINPNFFDDIEPAPDIAHS